MNFRFDYLKQSDFIRNKTDLFIVVYKTNTKQNQAELTDSAVFVERNAACCQPKRSAITNIFTQIWKEL